MNRPTDKREAKLITEIVDRAEKLARRFKQPTVRAAIAIDLVMAHRMQPLDLELLLKADDGNFAHDVFGIMRHIDRNSGAMRDCFVPRFARFQHDHDAS
jgi:hypothetical protein